MASDVNMAAGGTDKLSLYADLLREEQGDAALRASLALGVDANPDAVAKQRQQAKQLGTTYGAVAAIPDEAARVAKVGEITKQLYDAPVLRREYTNSDFAKVAHDDSGVLSFLEREVGAFVRYTLGGGFIGTAESAPSRLAAASLGAQKAAVDVVEPWLRLAQGPDNFLAHTSRYYKAMAAEKNEYVDRVSREYGNQGGITGGGLDSGVNSLLQNTKYMPLALTGPQGAALALLGMAIETFGTSYNKASEKNVDLIPALGYALSDATVEWWTERAPLFQLVGGLKAGSPLMKLLIGNIKKEVPGEQVATVLQDFNEWAAINPQQTLTDFLTSRPAAAAQTLIATIIGSGGNTLIAQGLQKAADALAPDVAAARIEGFKRLEQAMQTAAQSKLRERDPQAFAELLQQMAENGAEGAPAAVYVDAEVLNQLDPQVLAQVLPSVVEQLPAATAVNGTVAVPIGELMANVPGTPLEQTLMQSIRLTEDGETRAEAEEGGKRAQEFLEQQAAQVLANAQDQAALHESAEKVRVAVFDQLTKTRRFNDKVNNAYAVMWRDFFVAISEGTGMTPDQHFAKYNSTVLAQGLPGEGGEVLNADTTTPAFKAWFGDSKAVVALNTETGKPVVSSREPKRVAPQVMYHTTRSNFDVFEVGRPTANSGTFGDWETTRAAIFVTPDVEASQAYGRAGKRYAAGANVMPVYVKAENPLDLTEALPEGVEQRLVDAGLSYRYLAYTLGKWEMFDDESGADLVEILKAVGYDSVIFNDSNPDTGESFESWAVFSGTQIKSAIGNDGSYDADDPSTLSQRAESDTRFRDRAVELLGKIKPPQRSAVALMRGEVKAPRFANIFGISEWFTRKNQRGAEDMNDPAVKRRMLDALYADTLMALTDSGSAVGWYDAKVKAALDIMAEVHPEIATDPEARFGFVTILAITSNQTKVNENFALADALYSSWKETGVFPTDVGAVMDTRAKTEMSKSLAKMRDLIAEHGADKVREFMTTKRAARDIEAFTGYTVTGESKDSLVYGATFLGPKIGAFFNNLYGNFDTVTMDRWFMRTINRIRGSMLALPGSFGDTIARIDGHVAAGADTFGVDAAAIRADIAAFNALPEEHKGDILKVLPVVPSLRAYAHARHGVYARGRVAGGKQRSYVDRTEENLDAKNTDLALQGDQQRPRGGADRQLVRELVGKLQRMLQSDGIDMVVADIQAALWYYEKDLFALLKGQRAQADLLGEIQEAEDYETAARRVVAARRGDTGRDAAGLAGRARSGTGKSRAPERQFAADPAQGVTGDLFAQQDGGAEAGAAGVLDDAGVRGGAGVLADAPGTDSGPLAGLPAVVRVDGRDITFGPFQPARDAARKVAERLGLRYAPPTTYAKVDKERAARIADAFEAMTHAPDDPAVKAAYDAMIAETLVQWQAIKETGLVVEFITGDDPYGNPRNAILDVVENNHLWVYPTDAGFGGSESADVDISGNPLLQIVPGETISGRPVRANDIFRVVHDYFGHLKEGVGFRAEGEENAWRAHWAMFTPLARKALTVETRGQNSWVNFGPFAESNKTANGAETQYAPQKIGLLPDWVVNDGATDDALEQSTQPRVGYHFSTGQRTVLDGRFWGTGLKGAERERLSAPGVDPRLRERVAVYIDTGNGIQPEAGVGGFAHEVPLPRLYDAKADPLKLAGGGANAFESRVLDAGFDGYWVPDFTTAQGAAVILGPASRGLRAQVVDAPPRPGTTPTRPQDREWQVYAADATPEAATARAESLAAKPSWAGYELQVQGSSVMYRKKDAQPVLAQPRQSEPARGTFSPSRMQIVLNSNADRSTFLHESAHFFLEVMADLASQPDAPPRVVENMNATLRWLGVTDLYEWNTLPLKGPKGKEPYHERFAEAFEQYLFEGRAPSIELRKVFRLFREFMIGVYKSLRDFQRGRNLKMSDDIRQVFDRMLATDEQIAAAEQRAGFEAIYSNAAEAGMTPEEWAIYHEGSRAPTQAAIEALQKRSMADLKWATGAQSKELKRRQAEAKGLRDRMRDDVAREVRATPIEQARAFIAELRASTPEEKAALKAWGIARKDARNRLGEEVKAAWLARPENEGLKGLAKGQWLTKNRRLMANEADRLTLEWEQANPRPVPALKQADMDLIAERFGFTSGDHLRRELMETPKANDMIEALTDQRMLEEYGDLVTKEGMEQAANEAVHNEARGRALATELAMLEGANARTEEVTGPSGKKRQVNVVVRAAKDFAAMLVTRRKVRDLRVSTFAAAERRAGKKIMEAMKAGDTAGAAAAKRDQLLNHYAVIEANKATAEVERLLRYLRKFDKASTREALPPEYLDQIDQLLERFDLRQVTNRQLDSRASLKVWLEEQRELGFEPDIPPEVEAEANRMSYRDMTVEQFRGLADTVEQIEHLGRLKSKLLTAKDKREFEAVKTRIVDSINANAGDRRANTRTPNTLPGIALQKLKGFWASHIKAATWAYVMDGGKDGGPVWEYLIRSANDAGHGEIVMREQATKALTALLAPILKKPMGGTGVYVEGSPTKADADDGKTGSSFNREAMIAIALNTGNDSNFQRLTGGEGWTPAQVQAILNHMEAADWKFVQSVWDYFETYRPLIAAKERRVSGREPKWIEAVPREVVAADGTVIQLRGGYYPVKYDTRASDRAEQHSDAEASKADTRAAYTAATTRRSFVKTRAKEVHDQPLLYALDGIYAGVNEVIHDLSRHEWLIDAGRLLRDKQISAAMRTKYGPEAHQQLKRWMKDVAVEEAAPHFGDAFARWVRQGVSIAGLGFNIMSALIQPLGITQSIVRVGPTWVGRGIARMVSHPIALADEINEKSDFMRTRSLTRLRELAEVRAQVKGQTKARRAIDGGAYFMMLRMQQTVDLPTWWGAYEKAVSEGNDEDRSVALADQAVIDAQGSGIRKDLSGIERGSEALKLFTVFYQFFNTALNAGVAQVMTNKSKAKLAANLLLLYTVPALLGDALKDALTPGGDEDESWQKTVRQLIGSQLSYLTGLMFGVREIGTPIANIVKGEKFGTDYTGPAGLKMLGDATRLTQQAAQGEADDALRKAIINVAGDLLRLPSAQINRSITGAQALKDGKTNNPAALLMGYKDPN